MADRASARKVGLSTERSGSSLGTRGIFGYFDSEVEVGELRIQDGRTTGRQPSSSRSSLRSLIFPHQSYLIMTDANPPDRSLSFPLGTRASKLALVQAHQAAKDFTSSLSPSSSYSNLSFPVIPMSVAGDRNKTSPLYLLSTSTSIITPAKSLWTEELETALLKGELDAIINCCKDTPTNLPEGCEIGMLFPRPDPRDVLVVKHGLEYKTLGDLPDGSVVGTSSVRRIAQLRRHYPRLKVMDVVSLPTTLILFPL